MFACQSCGKVFHEKSSRLRHISHTSVCKEFYGTEKLIDLRRAARLKSKVDWQQNHKDYVKQKYQEEKGKRKALYQAKHSKSKNFCRKKLSLVRRF